MLRFEKVLNRPAVKKAFTEFEGEALTRPPKGFPPEHPAMDLIKCKQWGAERHAAGGDGA